MSGRKTAVDVEHEDDFKQVLSDEDELAEVGLENVIHLISLEEFLVLLLKTDDPRLRKMFSDAVLTQRFSLFNLRLGI